MISEKHLLLIGIAVMVVAAGATFSDYDGDGLSNYEEFTEYPTDLRAASTDGDGLNDAAEMKHGTNPRVADSDYDCFSDSREVNVETDPNARDTDGDGLPDGVEAKATGLYPNASPMRKDIFIEVDYMEGYQLPPLGRVRTAFRTAPVSNPDGSTGIDLHIVKDESVPRTAVLKEPQRTNLYQEQFDHQDHGYIYAGIVNEVQVTLSGDPGVFPGAGAEGYLYVTGRNDRGVNRSSLFMHELGHALGLSSSRYRGIDSSDVSMETYPSVMNYNSPRGYFQYAGSGKSDVAFDDWKHINETLAEPKANRLTSRCESLGNRD